MGQLVVQLLGQLALPPVLLKAWGDPGYALFVAIQGFGAYISVSDAGIQTYLTQRLATLRALGRDEEAAHLTTTGLRALRLLASFGLLAVSLGFVATGHAVWSGVASKAHLGAIAVLAAAAGQFASGAVSVAFGGWTTSVDCGHGRYVRVQAFGMGRTLVSMGAAAAAAVLGGSPAMAIFAASGGLVALEAVRFALVYRSERPLARKEATGALALAREAAGSVVLTIAQTTQSGLQAYVTTAISTAVVGVAVPGRTLANGARSLASAASTVVWVPIAARFAELAEPEARYAFWRRNAPLLSVLQLAGVIALLALAPLVVPRWLPSRSSAILALLPYYCAEQCAYAATVPTVVLLQAAGWFAALGGASLLAALVSVAATIALVPSHGASGFAFASAASAQLVLVPGLLGLEWLYWRRRGVAAGGALARRALVVPLSFGAAVLCRRSPAGAALALALVTAALAALTLHRRRLARAPGRARSSP
jgi:hypothetical protein